MKNRFIVFLFLLTASLCGMAQDTNYVRQVIRQLTSDGFHGRGYSFRGDSIAADFIRGELRRMRVNIHLVSSRWKGLCGSMWAAKR